MMKHKENERKPNEFYLKMTLSLSYNVSLDLNSLMIHIKIKIILLCKDDKL